MAQEFERAGARILAICPDSLFAHKAFLKELNVPFPLLSDLNREVVNAYGVLHEGVDPRGYKGAVIRSVFVVDQSGKIRYQFANEDSAQLPSVPTVLDAVRQIANT